MSDIFLNGELKGVCSEELAEAIGLWIGQKDASIAELKAENAALKEAAQAVVESEMDARRQQVTHWQNPTIDALAALLHTGGQP